MSEEGMDGAKERGQGGSERREEGATERGRGEREERGRRREIGRVENFNGGTLRRTLASIYYTAVSERNNTQRGPCHCDFGITGNVMRRNS